MAIEAMNGAISYQTQGYTQTKPLAAEKSTTDGTMQDIQVNVDPKTAAVVKSQESETEGNDSENNGSSENRESNEQLKKAISELNKNSQNTQVQFGVHEGTNRVTIKIVDKDTKKVVREFPAEKTLDMIAKVWELAGLLVDEKR